MSINITEKKIKSKIKIGDTLAVMENIKYPYFESQKYKKLCGKMNEFYASVAEKYSYHARNRLPKRIKLNRLSCKLPMTVAMSYTIALCDEKIVSVVLDLTFAEGKNIKTRRFSQMWSTQNNDILPVSELIRTDREGKKRIYSLVASAAKENAENPAFGYFGDYLIKLSKHFDIRNCFAVPKGICFFINAGVLAPVKYGASCFALSIGKLQDMLKGKNLTDSTESAAQNENIVNNI